MILYKIIAILSFFRISTGFLAINNYACKSKIKLLMKWAGDRPPLPNMEILDQKMDATWGRGKFRSEVWEDDVNPLNNWWTAYEPSEEQAEAAEMGYDFKNPQAWFEVQTNYNIIYDIILLEYDLIFSLIYFLIFKGEKN